MFCFQCQETAKGKGCTIKGVCGKEETTSNLQDLLIYNLKGIAVLSEGLKAQGAEVGYDVGRFISKALFTTITNANFDDDSLVSWVDQSLACKKELLATLDDTTQNTLHESATWFCDNVADYQAKAKTVGVLATENEDVRSLRELLIIGLKGIAAYADHAAVLGVEKDEIYDFIIKALVSTTEDLSVDEMVGMVMKAGECSEHHGSPGPGQHHRLWQSGNFRSQHRCK